MTQCKGILNIIKKNNFEKTRCSSLVFMQTYMKCKGFNLALSTPPRHKPAAYSIETAVGATMYSGLRSFNKQSAPERSASALHPCHVTPSTAGGGSIPETMHTPAPERTASRPPTRLLRLLPTSGPPGPGRPDPVPSALAGDGTYVARALTVKNDRQLAGMVLEAITGLNVWG